MNFLRFVSSVIKLYKRNTETEIKTLETNWMYPTHFSTFLSSSLTLCPPPLILPWSPSSSSPPCCPVALLCSLNRNDSLWLWINEDSISLPHKLNTQPFKKNLLFPMFHFFCLIFFYTFSLSIIRASLCFHLTPLTVSLPLSFLPVISISIADSHYPFIAPSLGNPTSSIHILSAHVCSTLVVYCAWCAGLLFICTCIFLCAHIHEGNKPCCLCRSHMSNVYYIQKHKAITRSNEAES